MTWPRNVAPEILDHLPPNDPVVVQCRRDLRLINTLTGNARTVADALAQHSPQAPRVLVDFGAGDGTFMLRVAQRLAPRWHNVTVVLLDRQGYVEDETREAFAALKWNVETVTADLFDYLEQMNASSGAVMTANLFVHHFERTANCPTLGSMPGLAVTNGNCMRRPSGPSRNVSSPAGADNSAVRIEAGTRPRNAPKPCRPDRACSRGRFRRAPETSARSGRRR
jgi:hypothetical protein